MWHWPLSTPLLLCSVDMRMWAWLELMVGRIGSPRAQQQWGEEWPSWKVPLFSSRPCYSQTCTPHVPGSTFSVLRTLPLLFPHSCLPHTSNPRQTIRFFYGLKWYHPHSETRFIKKRKPNPGGISEANSTKVGIYLKVVCLSLAWLFTCDKTINLVCRAGY